MIIKADCVGCRSDFYNNHPGIEECWSFKGAKMELRKEVHIHQVPPWTQKAKLIPHCYYAPGYIYVAPDRVR